MAAKQELVAPLEIEIGVLPRLKEEKDPTDYTSRVDPEVSRDGPVAYSAGTSTSEFLNWATPPLIKQGADLRHQPQELGKPLESIPSKWRDSCLPQLSKGEDVETPPLHSKEAAGRYRHQAGWEAPNLQQACEGQGSSRRVKEETPDEDTVDLVIRCQSFRGFCYAEAQGPKGAYVRLRELCLQWLEPERRTKEEILEVVILEQFLTILPPEMQNWLREIGPKSCSQAVALAENFLLRQGEAKNREQQVPTPPGEVDASFSKAIQTRFDASQRPLCREVKQESEADTCFLGGDRQLSEPRLSGVPSVKAEGEKMENDSEIVKMDTQPAKWRSKSVVAEGDQFQEVREQIIGGKGCDPCHKMLVSPSRQNPHQQNPHQHGFPNSGESVDYKSKLITHQRIQAGEKPYKYSECGQCQSPLLITPQRFHTEGWMTQNTNSKESAQGWVSRSRYGRHSGGENPHQCADCGKSFHYKSQLIRHQRVHSGEKPYPCSDCGKSFSQRQHLIDHQKLHTGKNPHRCFDCGKSFSYMSQLLVHQRSHTGEKPFPCLDCAQHFSRRAHLLRHQRRIHGRENLC